MSDGDWQQTTQERWQIQHTFSAGTSHSFEFVSGNFARTGDGLYTDGIKVKTTGLGGTTSTVPTIGEAKRKQKTKNKSDNAQDGS